MLIACPKCGAANDEHAQECYVCGATYLFEEEAIEREKPVPAPRALESEERLASAETEEQEISEPEEIPGEVCADSSTEEEEEAEPEAEDEAAEVIGFAPSLPPPPPARGMQEKLASALASTTPATFGTSALDPAARVKEMPRPAHLAPPAPEPEWRKEVARRLEDYRARRRRSRDSDAASQGALPFNDTAAVGPPSDPSYLPYLRRHSFAARPLMDEAQASIPSGSAPMHRAEDALTAFEETVELPKAEPLDEQSEKEQIEINVPQPKFDFVFLDEEDAHPRTELVPVADLRERTRAGLLDVLFLGLTFGVFLLLFRAFGGQISFGKQEALVHGLAFFLFYALYFAMFTVCGGATPGMYFRGLSVVAFDGNLPDTGQLLWRSFGYVVSGGTLFLGYLWSLLDEDHLTWHDRMSQTYLARVSSAMWSDLSDADEAAEGEASAESRHHNDDSDTLPQAT